MKATVGSRLGWQEVADEVKATAVYLRLLMKSSLVMRRLRRRPVPALALWRSVLSMMMAKDRMKGVSEFEKGQEGLSLLSAT